MSKSNLPGLYSQQDLANARTKGQIVGWIQGGAAGALAMILVGFIGWLPTLAVVGIGRFALYKLLAGARNRD